MTWVIIACAALLIIALILRSSWFKAKEELYLAIRLHLGEKEGYHVIRNVTVPADVGGSALIDHVIVSPFGVFVVVTMRMKGAIFGGERVGTWTQQLGRGSFTFESPLRRNGRHTKTLSEILGVPYDRFRQVVVFVGECEFKKPLPPNVLKTGGYIDYIKSYGARILSDDEVAKILKLIEEKHLTPRLNPDQAHVRSGEVNTRRN